MVLVVVTFLLRFMLSLFLLLLLVSALLSRLAPDDWCYDASTHTEIAAMVLEFRI